MLLAQSIFNGKGFCQTLGTVKISMNLRKTRESVILDGF